MGRLSLIILNVMLLLAAVQYSDTQDSGTELQNTGENFKNKIEHLFGQQTENDLVFVLDSSGSVGSDNYDKAKEFIKQMSKLITISASTTRVTLLAYSGCEEVIVYFNYIAEPSGNNQCSLPNDVDSVLYISGSTCTSAAIQEAGEILNNQNRRPNVARFVILLTDGRSNDQTATVREATKVKGSGIVILCIGLGGNVNIGELESTATSHDHIFLLDDIGDISNLGAIVKGDVSDKDFELLTDSSQCGQCDPHAACTCATKSGSLGCTCAPGFYGTGMVCSDCMYGFYKSSYGNVDCTICPDHSTTSSIQSTSISSCRCLTGYDGTPESGNDCEPIQCKDITPLIGQGVIRVPCSRTFNSVCQFQCEDNYRELGGATSITCLASKFWSDSPLQCQKITCGALPQATNNIWNCSMADFDIGTTCTFVCDVGYVLEDGGSNANLTCGKINNTHAVWTGTVGVCRKRTCPLLTKKDPLRIEPSIECQTPEFNQTCSFGCKDGYSIVGNQISRMCQADGSWSSQNPNGTKYCIDSEAPQIMGCTDDIFGVTDLHRPTALVSWLEPIVVDNSGIPVDLRSNHDQSYAFPIGNTTVIYTATDGVGLITSCNFTVNITDEEEPRIIQCPSDMVHTNKTHRNISSEDYVVEFIDNSGEVITRAELPSSGQVKEGKNVIRYIATDPSGNEKVCKFNIFVQIYQCQYQPAPLNGAVACSPPTSGNQFCSATCNQNFQFNGVTEEVYTCTMDANGEWRWVETTLWPDCTEPQYLDKAEISSSFQFFRGQCRKHLGKISQIRTKLIEQLKTLNYCQVDADCNITDVIIECGNSANSTSARSRRQAENQGNILTVLFTTVVTPRDNGTSGGAGQNSTSVSGTVQELTQAFESSLSEKIAAENITIEIDGETFQANPDSVDVDENARAVCPSGHVVLNDTCLSCTPGTFMNERAGICQKCQPGDYQDEFAQVECKTCPAGTSSDSTGSRTEEDCRAFCSPGSFSKSGLESCNACPVGTFQDRTGWTSCEPCPSGLTTWTPGARSAEDCVDLCLPGHFSDTGFQPCTACPMGTYQPMAQQTSCISCPAGQYTHRRGADVIQYCQVINECEEDPCLNGAACEDIPQGYLCHCLPGYTGSHCETDIDECYDNDVCLNNATCIDGVNDYECHCAVGFQGENCQINIDDCLRADCRFGGTCIDGIESYTCRCKDGFAGDHCEFNLFDCASNPCQNGATCMDQNSAFTCCCAPGFTGLFCEEVKNYCDSSPCHGSSTCTSTERDYQCACSPGYTGRNCDTDINDCATEDVCLNGGICQDLVNDFRCNCPDGFSGDHCQTQLSSDFDLQFDEALISNRAELSGVLPDLHEFTLSFWMKTTDTDHYGTPVSYAVREQNGREEMDNALTLQDYNNFVLSVNQELAYSFVSGNRDSDWHFVAVTWTSVRGDWTLYLDGVPAGQGSGLSVGKPILGRGHFVVGQEQDSYGGSYVPLESFVGTISQVNVWDYAMTSVEVKHVQASCSNSGNALSWAQLSTGIHGNNIKRTSGLCPITTSECRNDRCTNSRLCRQGGTGLDCDAPNSCAGFVCEHGGTCKLREGQAVCSCPDGFEGRQCQFDTNECLVDNGGCMHNCVNTHGSFSCTCQTGYALQPDEKTCKDVLFCLDKGKFHLAGETWGNGCNTCSCVDGRAECVATPCPRINCAQGETILPGACCPVCLPETKMCSVNKYGVHNSFDGRKFDRTGECRYLLTKDCGGTGNFEVHFEHDGDIEHDIVLFIYSGCVEIKIDARGLVYVWGEQVALPFHHRSTENVDVIQVGASDVEVTTDKGLWVIWSQSEVLLNLTTDYSGSACGLCGNMNGNLKDDKLTKEFIKSRSNKELLHSWKVNGYTHCKQPIPKEGQVIKFGTTETKACSFLNYLDFLRARGKCRVLYNSLFSGCRHRVSPKNYFDACLEDACTCGVGDPCHCEAISEYANECQRNGVKITGWKRLTTCYIDCPPTMVYDDCGRACEPTCSDPGGKRCGDLPAVCKPGCSCPAGRVLHDDRCLMQSSCPAS